jgi:two-component system phosphate regulon sensor histidine kinase PhoR
MSIAILLLTAALIATLYVVVRQRREMAVLRKERQTLNDRIAELKQNVHLSLDAAEALPDGVVILDGQRRIEWLNAKASESLDISSACDIGVPIHNLLREPAFVAFITAAEPGSALEFRTRRNAKQMLHVQWVPFSGERVLLLVRDVTQLDRLATMRRDFVANVSHELKTPLTVTLGFIETAQDALADTPPAEIAKYLQTAADQAERMRRLIGDLLTLSSLETDAPPPLEETVPLADLIGEVHSEALAISAGRHDIVLEAAAAPGLRGSSRELYSALLNLASNAVRYTPEGGRISMTWRDVPNGGGEFCVTDSGIGIAPEHIGRLTERFYRVDRGRSREVGGTGLGLAIVKHVLERHGAALRITSEPGRGSTFCASFPAARMVR